MSPFQALTTSIAAQVGTGNIVGASAAILVGGPGADFGMQSKRPSAKGLKEASFQTKPVWVQPHIFTPLRALTPRMKKARLL